MRFFRVIIEYLIDNFEEGDFLLEFLKKVLYVMSLLVKELDGNDGNLLLIVGFFLFDVEVVYNRLFLVFL